MIYKINNIKDDFICEIYDNSMNELNVFFGINWQISVPSVILVDDREVFDNILHRKTENWEVAWANGQSRDIYIFSREKFEEESNQKYSDEYYASLIGHELSHLFYSIFTGGNYIPIWLNEGVAIYTSGQNKLKRKIDTFCKFLEFYDFGGKDVYSESGFFVEGLINKFGKQKFLNFIKEQSNLKTKEEFEKLFSKTFGFTLEYSEINKQGFLL